MGKIELDHTGSGSGITLSSDGTDLLLDGTAIGGGGGGGATELNDLSDAVGNATTDNYGAGRDVLGDITTGQENTAFGALAGQQITTGSANTFYGRNAGRFVTTGSSNVGIGLGAASGTNLDKQTGDYNIGIGYNAGNAVVSTDKNTAVGYNADNTGNPAGSTAIGSDAVAAGNQATALTDSYASGTDSFAAAIANNTSSYGATGSNSIAISQNAKASSSEAIALGPYTQATANAAVSIGAFSDATAQRSFALGNYAKAGSTGKFAFSNQRYAAVGDTQGGLYVLRQQTNNATPIALTTSSGGTPSSTQIILPSGSAYAFTGTIVAKQLSSSNAAAWEVKGLIVNQGGTTTLTNSATTVISNTPSWGMALSADDTNDALAITVTGAASTTIRWVANIQTSEVSIA